MIPAHKGRLIGLIALLIVLVFFLTRQEKASEKAQEKAVGNSIPIENQQKTEANSDAPSQTHNTASLNSKGENTKPVIQSIQFSPIPVSAGETLRVEVVSYDQDDDFVQLRYEWRVNGIPIIGNDMNTLDGDQVHSGDQILVYVTPSDLHATGDPIPSPLVTVLNLAPEIVSLPPNEDSNGRYTYQVEAKDKDGDTLTYSLLRAPPGMEIGTTTGLVQWAVVPATESQSSVAVEVTDGKGGKVIQQFRLKIVSK